MNFNQENEREFQASQKKLLNTRLLFVFMLRVDNGEDNLVNETSHRRLSTLQDRNKALKNAARRGSKGIED